MVPQMLGNQFFLLEGAETSTKQEGSLTRVLIHVAFHVGFSHRHTDKFHEKISEEEEVAGTGVIGRWERFLELEATKHIYRDGRSDRSLIGVGFLGFFDFWIGGNGTEDPML